MTRGGPIGNRVGEFLMRRDTVPSVASAAANDLWSKGVWGTD